MYTIRKTTMCLTIRKTTTCLAFRACATGCVAELMPVPTRSRVTSAEASGALVPVLMAGPPWSLTLTSSSHLVETVAAWTVWSLPPRHWS